MINNILMILMIGACLILAGTIGYAFGFKKGVDEQFKTDQKEMEEYNKRLTKWIRNGFKDEGNE